MSFPLGRSHSCVFTGIGNKRRKQTRGSMLGRQGRTRTTALAWELERTNTLHLCGAFKSAKCFIYITLFSHLYNSPAR